MIYGVMFHKFLAGLLVDREAIRYQRRVGFSVLLQHFPDILPGHIRHNLRTGFAIALYKGYDRRLIRRATSSLAMRPSADVRLVCLYHARKLLLWFALSRGQRKADTMGHEPCGAVANAQRTRQFQRRYAILARVQQMNGEQSLGYGNVAMLHDGADKDGEGLSALTTFPETAVAALACTRLAFPAFGL